MGERSKAHHGPRVIARRDFVQRAGGGSGGLALASLLGADGLLAEASPASPRPNAERRAPNALSPDPLCSRPAHFPAKVKRVISLFMFGGISHIDTFDPKP